MGGWLRVGGLIIDKMSYRNHYMCSGEATRYYEINIVALTVNLVFCSRNLTHESLVSLNIIVIFLSFSKQGIISIPKVLICI